MNAKPAGRHGYGNHAKPAARSAGARRSGSRDHGDHPLRAKCSHEADETPGVPHVVFSDHLRGTRLRARALCQIWMLAQGPTLPVFNGTMSFCTEYVVDKPSPGSSACSPPTACTCDHGEQVVREFVKSIPDGTYRASCQMYNNGPDDSAIQFDVVVTVRESNIRIDFSAVPDAQRGPVNCLFPSTVITTGTPRHTTRTRFRRDSVRLTREG